MGRVEPALGAEHMKTYAVAAPLATHWRPATCAEVDCAALALGWRSLIDEATDLGRRQAHYIRAESGRSFTEERDPAGLTVFTFAAGQTCFATHQAPLEREPLYLVREGDWRGNPRGVRPRVHVRAGDWVDDFATHQQRLADRLERG